MIEEEEERDVFENLACIHCYEYEFKKSDFTIFEMKHHISSHGDVDVYWDTFDLRATCPKCGAVTSLYAVSDHGIELFEVIDGELI